MRICGHCGFKDKTDERYCPICGEVVGEQKGRYLILHEKRMKKIDAMSGQDFEDYCCRLLQQHGYIGINKTKASGDHGADILAEKDGITYAFQCKCYRKPVGNSAIQEIYAAKTLYRRDIGVLLTNRTCTKQAMEEAKSLGVKIWDRTKLSDLILNKSGVL